MFLTRIFILSVCAFPAFAQQSCPHKQSAPKLATGPVRSLTPHAWIAALKWSMLLSPACVR